MALNEEEVKMEVNEGGDDNVTVPAQLILGEKLGLAYAGNESKNIDFFFNVVPSSSMHDISVYLREAWLEDPNLCLKLVFNLNNVRKEGAGKQDRNNFYRCILLLWKVDPQIVLVNLDQIHRHASLKVMLDCFMFIAHLGLNSRFNFSNVVEMKQKIKEGSRTKSVTRMRGRSRYFSEEDLSGKKKSKDYYEALWQEFAESIGVADYKTLRVPRSNEVKKKQRSSWKPSIFYTTCWKDEGIRQQYIQFTRQKDVAAAKENSAKYKLTQKDNFSRVLERRRQDPHLDALYNKVVDLFCAGIKDEMDTVKAIEAGATGKTVGGLFGKWAPSRNGMHDRATGICRELIKKLLPLLDIKTNPIDSTKEHNRVYQALVLAKIRLAAQVPEHYVGRGEWNLVNYDRMASRCRLMWGESLYKKHDEERYNKFLLDSATKTLKDPKAAKEGVKTGVLLPHEVTKKALTLQSGDKANDEMQIMEVNLQWWGLVKSCKEALESGDFKLGYCLPICDVSGSMHGEPMDVAVALSLLLTESMPACCPYRGRIFTFHEQPSLCELKTMPDYDKSFDVSKMLEEGGDKEEGLKKVNSLLGDLGGRVREVLDYDWGGTTNLEATYKLLLKLAKDKGISQELMAKTCIVLFTDMEFDCATNRASDWETTHQSMERKFKEAGYEQMPIIVYWNLRASRSQPIHKKNHKGVVLLSGFSSGLLKSFLKGELDQFTPMAQLMQTVSDPLYKDLKVPEDCKEMPTNFAMDDDDLIDYDRA